MLLVQMIVIQIITFAGLVFVLIKIMRATSFFEIKRMKQLSQESAQKTQELNAKIEETERLYKERMDQAQQEAATMKAQVQEEAQRQKDALLLEAKQEAERILKLALNTKEKIKEEVAFLVHEKSLDQALLLIRQVLNAKQMIALHEILTVDIIQDMNSIDVARFKLDTPQAQLIAAHAISAAQQKQLTALLAVKTGKEIQLESSLDPELLAGIIVKLGNLVIDASLRGRLREASEALRQ